MYNITLFLLWLIGLSTQVKLYCLKRVRNDICVNKLKVALFVENNMQKMRN